MKRNRISGFTLIEMLTVMVIIAVVASLIVGVAGLVNKKAAISRATGEIESLTTACERYKADNGSYPTHTKNSPQFKGGSAITDDLDPRKDTIPTDKKYKLSSLYLYSQLSGDAEGSNGPDGKPESNSKVYFDFKPGMLSTKKEGGTVKEIEFIQDPFGQSYGYSTAAATAESEYRDDLRKKPGLKRPSKTPGYNVAGFDLWSTGGTSSKTTSQNSSGEPDQSRWIKNW